MRSLIPVITAGAAIIGMGILTALGHPYAGYATAVALLIFAGIIALITTSQERIKPCVVPVRFGQHKPGSHYGLIVMNERESAFNISIPENEIPIGSSQLVFWSRNIPRLTKENGEALIEAHLALPSRTTLTGDGLFDQMVKNKLAEVTVDITYKDGGNRWYKTICRIERDVLVSG